MCVWLWRGWRCVSRKLQRAIESVCILSDTTALPQSAAHTLCTAACCRLLPLAAACCRLLPPAAACCILLLLAAPCSLMPFSNAKSRFSKRNSYFHRFSLTPLTPWRSHSSSQRLCYRFVQRASSTNPPHRRCPPHNSQLPQWLRR